MRFPFIGLFTFCFLFTGIFSATGQGLIVNEISQGASGSQGEWAELVVVGPPCTTVDIRNWVLDDNNGDFLGCGPGSGLGIAPGHIRFTNNPVWAEVPVGTIILVYSANPFDAGQQADISPWNPNAPDFDDSNCDYVRLVPMNASSGAYIEINPDFPNSNDPSDSYTPGVYQPFGNTLFSMVGLRNGGDAFQVRTPSFTLFHGIGYGSGSNAACIGAPVNGVYNSALGGGTAIFFDNSLSDDYYTDANFASTTATGGSSPGTPGQANTCDNAEWILSMRRTQFEIENNCTTTNFTLDMCVGDSETVGITDLCNGEMYSNATIGGGNAGVTINSFNPASISFTAISPGTTFFSVDVALRTDILFPQGGCNPPTPVTFNWTINIGGGSSGNDAFLDGCQDPSTGLAVFDLTSVSNIVNGGSGEAVTYFENANGTGQILNPTNYISVSGQPVFAQVGSGGSGSCAGSLAQITLNILSPPTANTVAPTACDTDGDGLAEFNLFDIAAQINNQFGNTVSFYSNAAGTIPLTTQANYATGNATIYAQVSNNSANCSSAIIPINFTVIDASALAASSLSLTPDSGCGPTNATLTFNLPNDGNSYDISVEINEGGVVNTVDYNNVSNGDSEPFVLSANTTFTLTSVSSGICSAVPNTSVAFTYDNAPNATPTSLTACNDGSGGSSFNLNDIESIINGNTSETVNFYSDATLTNLISEANQANYTTNGNEIIYATVGSGICESNSVQIQLNVGPLITAEILGGQDVCLGEDADLTVAFSAGTAPFDFILLTNSGSPQVFNDVSNPFTITLSPLITSTYTIINASAGDCEAEEIGTVQVNVNTPPEASIGLDAVICEGESTDLTVSFTGTGTHTFVYAANNVDQPAVTTTDNPYTLTVNPTETTTYELVSYEDDNCTGTTTGTAEVTVNPTPTATLSGGGQICAFDDSAELIFTFEGTAPWTFVYSENAVNVPEITTFDNPYILDLSPNALTSYQIESVSSSACAGTVLGTGVDIDVFEEIVTENGPITCNPVDATYVVEFTITSGTAPFSVSGNSGTLNASNVFVSDPIPSGDLFSFTITDGNGCSYPPYTGVENCDGCITDAGTMIIPAEPLEFCEGEEAVVVHNGDETLEGDDILGFIIHTSPNPALSNPYIYVNDETAVFSGFLEYNTVYYYSAVAGNNDNGQVDFSDPCLSVSAGTPIIWRPAPSANLIGGNDVCIGQEASFSIDFEGVAPFTYSYTINGQMPAITAQSLSNQATETLILTENTTINLESISDANCSLDNINQSVDLNLLPEVSVQITDTICSGDNTEYQIVIELGGTAPYSVMGTTGNISGTTFTSDAILSGDNYFFEITDANLCNAIAIEGQVQCETTCTTAVGEMSFTGLELCVGDAASADYDATNEFADVDDALIFVLHTIPNNSLGTILGTNIMPTFFWNAATLSPNTTYYISAVIGNSDGTGGVDFTDPCLQVAPGQPVIWNQATANFVGTDAMICAGDCTDLIIEIENGVADFSVTVSNDAGTFEVLTSSNAQISYQVCPDVSTTYTITEFTANNCTGIVNSPDAISVSVSSAMSASSVTYDCSPDNTGYTAEFDIVGGVAPFTLTAGAGTIAGSTISTDLLTNNVSETLIIQDAFGCELPVTVVTNCQCGNDAGALDLTLVEACEDETVSVTQITAPTLEAGDVLAYIMHDNSGAVLGTIISSSLNTDFTVPQNYTFGTTVYISAVVAPDDGTGQPDLNDVCLSVSPGMPVIWYETPGIVVPADAELCEGQCIDLVYNLSGTPGFDFSLSIGGNEQAFTANSDTYTVNICPADYGILPGQSIDITALSIENAGCQVTLDGTDITALSVATEIMTLINPTICREDFIEVEEEIFDIDNPTGQFTLSNEFGCDSIVTVDLAFYDLAEGSLNQQICTGASIEIGGVIFDENMPSGQVTLPDASFNGCDSLLNVVITFSDAAIELVDDILCEDDEIIIAGETFNIDNPSGEVLYPFPSFNGCDSIAQVDLTFLNHQFGALDTVLCQGESAVVNGQTLDEENPTAQFTFPAAAFNGCDSILTVTATFLPSAFTEINETLELGETLTVGGEIFDENNPTGEVVFENGSYTGCDSIVSVTVSYPLEIVAEGFSPECFGESNGFIRIDTVIGGLPPYEITIDGTESGVFSTFPFLINFLSAGEYEVEITDSQGRWGVDNVIVENATQWTLELGENETIQQGEEVVINAQTEMSEIAVLTWTPTDSLSSDSTLTTIASPLVSTTYSLYLEDSLGCSVQDFITIYVDETRNVYIPQIFSPNDDGINDFFTIFADRQVVRIQSLRVYDRWGDQVFENLDFSPNNESLGWDGKHQDDPMNPQVLVYVAEIEFIDGKVEVFKGDVTLVR